MRDRFQCFHEVWVGDGRDFTGKGVVERVLGPRLAESDDAAHLVELEHAEFGEVEVHVAADRVQCIDATTSRGNSCCPHQCVERIGHRGGLDPG